MKKNSLYLAWGTALLATAGSFFFSNVLHFAPCVLCWWQRIFMYPLVIILAVAIINKDRMIHRYVLPLSVLGAALSLYQNLLTWGIIPESAAPCQIGVSCTKLYVNYLGFITIPFLSLLAFAFITIVMFVNKKYENK